MIYVWGGGDGGVVHVQCFSFQLKYRPSARTVFGDILKAAKMFS